MKVEEIAKLIESVHKYNISELSIKNRKNKIIIRNTDVNGKKDIETKVHNLKEKSIFMDEVKSNDNISEEKIVKTPLVGTFYSAPAEDRENFVKVGDSVVKGQTLAIVEAMKLMNEINSDQEGVIKEILVENGQMVEYGQPLFIIS